jgi:uncharacterized protein (TIGR02594 family)
MPARQKFGHPMRSRIAFAAAFLATASSIMPALAVPLPRERHLPPQHKPQAKPQERPRDAALAPAPDRSPFSQLSLSARTSYAMPALVAEARKYMGTNPTDRKRLWCATFMNLVLAKLGYAGTNSDAARSFAYYGRRISEPKVGAIAVLTRGKRGGHVGVVSGIDKSGNPIIISGNHNKLVGEAVYARSRVIAYVMPSEERAATRVASSGPVSLPAADSALDSPITELIAAIEAEQARAERPEMRRETRAAVRPQPPAPPPVPHRTVQQMPDSPRQASGAARQIGNPFSELIGTLEGRKRGTL